MLLTTYTHLLSEGESTLSFKKQHKNNLLFALQKEIQQLAALKRNQHHQEHMFTQILGNILDNWPIPVCIFDHELKLTYRNNTISQQLRQPLLISTPAKDLGFIVMDDQLHHQAFENQWQCQTLCFSPTHNEQTKHWLFTAIDISQLLNQQQTITQQNLIRVLSHELRNSLTPMYSMTDTLLESTTLDEAQTRKVLSRIQKRSKRLLNFVSEYSQLTQLPSPKASWFNFQELVEEASAMVNPQICNIQLDGTNQCFGDRGQLTQVMINLLKNSEQASVNDVINISIRCYYQEKLQIVEVIDDGPGFANLDNVLTPFYTTKANGSGIGLPLCAEIIQNHKGQFSINNNTTHGASIRMCWPLS